MSELRRPKRPCSRLITSRLSWIDPAHRPCAVIHPVRLNASHSPPHAQQSGSPDEGSYLEPVDVEWFGPHDRLFQGAESVPVNFKQAPPAVWCWGWDGANGDMHPEWQSLKTPAKDPTRVWRDRGFETAS